MVLRCSILEHRGTYTGVFKGRWHQCTVALVVLLVVADKLTRVQSHGKVDRTATRNARLSPGCVDLSRLVYFN